MRQYSVFITGLLAHAVGVIATTYADWLMQQIADGADASVDFWRDLKRFCRWLVRVLSEQLSGERRQHHRYEEDWRTGMYPS